MSLKSDRPILPQRRGATVAPDNGVPLIVNGKRSQTTRNMAIASEL